MEQKVKIVESGVWVIIAVLVFISASLNTIANDIYAQTKVISQCLTK